MNRDERLEQLREDQMEALVRKTRAQADHAERDNRYIEAADTGRVLDFVGIIGMKTLEYTADIARKWIALEPIEPILLTIHSPGGDIFAGMGIYDFLMEQRNAGVPVTTQCYGLAASMAAVLMQVGETRSMTRRSWFMVHQASTGFAGSLAELEDQEKLLRRLNDDCYDILASRSTLTSSQIKRRSTRQDWWLSAEEALEYGFIDGIVG